LDLDKFHALLAENVDDKTSGWSKNTTIVDKKRCFEASIHSKAMSGSKLKMCRTETVFRNMDK